MTCFHLLLQELGFKHLDSGIYQKIGPPGRILYASTNTQTVTCRESCVNWTAATVIFRTCEELEVAVIYQSLRPLEELS